MPTASPSGIPTPPIVVPEDRMTPKGTRFYAALLGGTLARMAAVKGISGPQLQREKLDATELDQVPASLGTGEQDEQYYYKHYYPGTKEVQPVTVTMNMKKADYIILIDWYDRDANMKWEIRFRARGTESVGAKLSSANCFVDSIGMEIDEGTMITVPVTFQPSGKVVFTDAT